MSTQRFHSRCGGNIKLSFNSNIARRVYSGIDDGIVFTEQPVTLDTVFLMMILVYDDRFYIGSIVSQGGVT